MILRAQIPDGAILCAGRSADLQTFFVIRRIFKPSLRILASFLVRTQQTRRFYNNNIYSGSSTHRSVFQGGPVIYIYIIHGKLYTRLYVANKTKALIKQDADVVDMF